MNIALGGTLYQHLADVLTDGESLWNEYHEINLESRSGNAKAMKTNYPKRSHSFHHQAVDKFTPGLVFTGTTSGQTIEAVKHNTKEWIVDF